MYFVILNTIRTIGLITESINSEGHRRNFRVRSKDQVTRSTRELFITVCRVAKNSYFSVLIYVRNCLVKFSVGTPVIDYRPSIKCVLISYNSRRMHRIRETVCCL